MYCNHFWEFYESIERPDNEVEFVYECHYCNGKKHSPYKHIETWIENDPNDEDEL